MISKARLVADPYPPYQFEENGRIIGVDHDVITESLKIQGITVETSLHSWDECMALMGKRKADGIFQITRTPERARRFYFSERLRTASALFYKKTGFAVKFNSTVDLASQLGNLKVGVLSGYSYTPAVDNLGNAYKIEKESSESLLNGLLQDEFALALVDRGVASYLMAKLRLEGIDSAPGHEISRELYVAFQKGLSELAHLFNIGLRRIKKNGVYGEVFRRYGLSE